MLEEEKAAQMVQREEKRASVYLEEMIEILARVLERETMINPFGPLWLFRSIIPTGPVHTLYNPSLCIVAQGSKLALLGETPYIYDPGHFLLASLDLPIVGQVLQASEEKPYLGLRLNLDPIIVGSVLVEMRPQLPPPHEAVRALEVGPIKPCLLETTLRLLRLVDVPQDIPVIAPLVIREIVYRLLTSEQGGRLQHIALLGGQIHRIARVVERLRADFDKPLRIEELARDLGMSVSGLHHHFKAVTSMSPIQFQKQLRLQEARRLMLGEYLDAASAGLRVGYEDASHFSREYKRLFGEPPIRDIERLRAMAASNS